MHILTDIYFFSFRTQCVLSSILFSIIYLRFHLRISSCETTLQFSTELDILVSIRRVELFRMLPIACEDVWFVSDIIHLLFLFFWQLFRNINCVSNAVNIELLFPSLFISQTLLRLQIQNIDCLLRLYIVMCLLFCNFWTYCRTLMVKTNFT